MTRAALSAALTAVADIRRYVAISERRIDAVKQLLSLEPPLQGAVARWVQDLDGFRDGRKFDYACAVILLYGALERFVEDATEEYLVTLAQCTRRYSDLPEKLRSTHFSLVLSHLQRSKEDRYDGRATAQQLVSAFSSCLQDHSPLEFLAESMLHHTANFRPAVVDDYLGRIGIDSPSRRAIRSEVFSSYLEASGRAVPEDRPEAILDLVTDLVSRRNEVAHGVVPNTLAPSELLPYCDQIDAYCQGLSAVLESSLLAQLARFYGVDHGKPLVVHNHSIVCIQSKGAIINVGDNLAIQRVDGSWYLVGVESIEIDGHGVTSTPEGVDVAVGLAIDGRCKVSYSVRSAVPTLSALSINSLVRTESDREEAMRQLEAEVSLWKDRRNEAVIWSLKNGDFANGAWLRAEGERCSRNLAEAEKRLADQKKSI